MVLVVSGGMLVDDAAPGGATAGDGGATANGVADGAVVVNGGAAANGVAGGAVVVTGGAAGECLHACRRRSRIRTC